MSLKMRKCKKVCQKLRGMENYTQNWESMTKAMCIKTWKGKKNAHKVYGSVPEN